MNGKGPQNKGMRREKGSFMYFEDIGTAKGGGEGRKQKQETKWKLDSHWRKES
jgi:hypothetical protein